MSWNDKAKGHAVNEAQMLARITEWEKRAKAEVKSFLVANNIDDIFWVDDRKYSHPRRPIRIFGTNFGFQVGHPDPELIYLGLVRGCGGAEDDDIMLINKMGGKSIVDLMQQNEAGFISEISRVRESEYHQNYYRSVVKELKKLP